MKPAHQRWMNANIPVLKRALEREVGELEYDEASTVRKLNDIRTELTQKREDLAEITAYLAQVNNDK